MLEVFNGSLVRRMLAMAWQYWRGCLKVIGFQVLLLATNVGGLALAGLGIDFITHHVDPARDTPRWPLGLAPPAAWPAIGVVALLAAGVLALGVGAAWFSRLMRPAYVRNRELMDRLVEGADEASRWLLGV